MEKLENIKALALDMDGTLLNDEQKISQDNKKAISQLLQKGIKVILATGRPIYSLERYLEELGLLGTQGYAICETGASIYSLKEEKYIYRAVFGVDNWAHLLHYLENDKNGLVLQLFTEEGTLYSSTPNERNKKFADWNMKLNFSEGKFFKESPSKFLEKTKNKISKLNISDEESLIENLEKELEEKFSTEFHFQRSLPWLIEVLPAGITKGVMIKKVCKMLGFTPQEVMAIGDSFNDVDMLKVAGVSFVIKNGVSYLDSITDGRLDYTNNESGVAKAIEKYLL